MLRATTGHIYRLADLLGRGVSCNVYKGVDKNTGKERALKIFNVSLPAHLNEALKREIEALKTLTHPNVVSFLGLEMEVTTGHQVLVMELCTGGTLLTVLGEPQFAFGLSEDEFRLFLCHIVCGLKHLRTNGFVHRDIKPGNILRSIGPDGKSVYKLSDFGSAKKLDLEGEQFMSMHGTEEYLHPDIFEKAFIDRSAVKQFTLAVDLWSIGATLYHAATGTVPFRPYGGRKNKATMFEMIAMKSGGVISGVQDSLNGPIEWDTKLPGTCLLSSDMRTAVEGMCAGMLEKNPGKMWTFDTFFFETEHLFEKIRVFVFNTVDCISDVLYMGPDSGLAELKGKVERHLGVEISEQILYFGEKPLDTNVRTATKMKDFPNTSEQKPILLFSTRGVERLELEPVVIAAFPVVPTNAGVIEDDCRAVKHSIEVQCGRQRVMESCRRSQELLVQGALSFRTHLLSELSVLTEKTTRESTTLEQLSESVRMSLDELEDVERQESLDRETYDFGDGGPSEDSGRNGLHRMKDLLSEKRKDLAEILKWCERAGEDELCGSYSGERSLEAKFGLKVLCAADCECVTGPNWQFGELKSLCKKFEERRRQVRPTYHEEKLHEFDRRHLVEVCEQSSKLLHEHCFPARDKVFNAFKAWHRVLSAVRKDLGYYREQFCGVVTSTEKTLRQYSQVQSYFTSRYRHSNPVSPKHHRSSADRDKKREHCLKIQKLDSTLCKSLQETSKLREEQSSLLSSFQSLGDTLQDTPDLFQLEDLNVK